MQECMIFVNVWLQYGRKREIIVISLARLGTSIHCLLSWMKIVCSFVHCKIGNIYSPFRTSCLTDILEENISFFYGYVYIYMWLDTWIYIGGNSAHPFVHLLKFCVFFHSFIVFCISVSLFSCLFFCILGGLLSWTSVKGLRTLYVLCNLFIVFCICVSLLSCFFWYFWRLTHPFIHLSKVCWYSDTTKGGLGIPLHLLTITNLLVDIGLRLLYSCLVFVLNLLELHGPLTGICE